MAEAAPESQIPDKLFFKIGEVAELTGTKPHVLRYWESEFKMLRPAKGESGQRIYRRKDVELIFAIKRLLYEENFTIAGAKKQLQRLRGVRGETARVKPAPAKAPADPSPALPFEPAPEPDSEPPQPAVDLAWLRKEIQGILDILDGR
ncbi:MAG: MerR family transcriptional regulator [Candidatus Tectomicrobia bacterium]|nr:MerR family transcriptional regulator [Candidatus Tectomicrobia bacterium]